MKDWNMDATELEEFGWSATVVGKVRAPSEATRAGCMALFICIFIYVLLH